MMNQRLPTKAVEFPSAMSVSQLDSVWRPAMLRQGRGLLERDTQSDPVYRTWISLMNKKGADGYGGLSAAERVFWGVYLLDLEVHNGGFLQYFGNTEGQYAGDLVGSLTEIGADETAARVERFFRYVFPGGVPVEASARRGLALRMEADYDQFRLDEEALTQWYWQDTDTIFDRLQRYAREHGFLVE